MIDSNVINQKTILIPRPGQSKAVQPLQGVVLQEKEAQKIKG